MSEPEAARPLRLGAAILITAGSGLVYELCIGTLSTYLMGDSALQFSLTIGFYMAAMGVGAWMARDTGPDPLRRLLWVEIAVALLGGLSGLILHAAHGVFLQGYPYAMVALVSLLGTLIGMELPLLAELMRRAGGVRGAFASALAIDYIGALIGAVAFPLALLPTFGTVKTALFAGAVNLVAVALLFPGLSNHVRARLRFALVATAAVLLAAAALSSRAVGWYEQRLYRDEILLAQTTRFQRIVLTRFRDDVRLYSDRELQFSSRDEFRYHEALVHPALAAVRVPESVLLIGGGDGLAVREVLKHPRVGKIVLVDIDSAMTRIGSTFPALTELNAGALSDPRVETINSDGFAFLRSTTLLFDVVILDLPDPRNEDLARLYSREMYQLVVHALSADGVVATQATSPYYARGTFWSIVATLESAGLHTAPYRVHVPSFAEWGFVVARRRSIETDELVLELPRRYLTDDILRAAWTFDADTARIPDAPVSTLENPAVWRLYRERVAYWRN